MVEVVPEPVVTSTVIQTFVPTEVIKDNRVWIDARPIHTFVNNQRQFANWINQRIEEIGAVENKDYLVNKSVKQVFHQDEPVIDGTQVQQFTFPLTNQTVRIVIGENGEPWWVATDVCRELGHVNAPQAISRHCKKDGISKQYTIDKMGRPQEVMLINEANLYRLINRSNTLHAETFQDWVCEKVLPSIRKTGGYGQQKQEIPDFSDPAVLNRFLIQQTALGMELKANVKKLEEKNTKLVTENVELHDHLDALVLGAVVR